MSMNQRTRMFKTVKTDDTTELDYLDNLFTNMDLPDVKTIRISSVYAGRPDRLALKELGDFNLGWLICWHNDILDPVNELTIGREIRIPSIQEYYRYRNRARTERQTRRR